MTTRKRGRPRLAPETQGATITLPTEIYDECCREAHARGVSLASILRDAIMKYARRSRPTCAPLS